jgi:peptide/nickel transport system ATP-binding protein
MRIGTEPLLRLDGLGVRIGSHDIVRDVTLDLSPGEVLGLVGESGSGKTTIALALLGYRPDGATFSGRVEFASRDVLTLPPVDLQALRGRRIAYVPQNPTTALNPARRIGTLMAEQLAVHGLASDLDSLGNALRDVGLVDASSVLASFPHQLSGGQQQRVVLALATLCEPDILVLDEPTTGLDVTTQAIVISHLRRLRDERRIAMVYVTHDLDLLSGIATHLAVLYAGRIMESGPAEVVFSARRHPYTRALLAATPSLRRPDHHPQGLPGTLRRDLVGTGCPFAARCADARPLCAIDLPTTAELAPGHLVACHVLPLNSSTGADSCPHPDPTDPGGEPVLTAKKLSVSYSSTGMIKRSASVLALAEADLDLHRGEILAVVGESGSGKSTLAKAIVGMVPGFSGRLVLDGVALAPSAVSRDVEQRRKLQFVFQNPDASLNPRRRVGQILADALRAARPGLSMAENNSAIAAGLAEVRLPESHAARYPDQLSGGERQRVALARALIANPEVLICDEVLSALDVSVQAGILSLLEGLCRDRNLAILFISHDLSVVRHLAHRVIVLYRGQIMAELAARALLDPPHHPYVSQLLEAAQGQQTRHATVIPPGPGCPFAPACQLRIDQQCLRDPPPWTNNMRCHRSSEELAKVLPNRECPGGDKE